MGTILKSLVNTLPFLDCTLSRCMFLYHFAYVYILIQNIFVKFGKAKVR